MVNYRNRGKWFEKAIEQSNTVYKHKGIAIVDKVPTPVNFNPRTNKAFYEGKSTVDFVGCDNTGRMIAFDAKEVKEKSLPYANIKQHQIDYLLQTHKLGARSFFLVFFRFNNTCYRMNISDFMIHKHTSKRKSIPYAWIEENCVQIVSKNGAMFDYLS